MGHDAARDRLPPELLEVREALAEAERRLADARVLHASNAGPAPSGLEEDVAVLRAEELRLATSPRP